LYLGYPPRNKNERKKFIEKISTEPYTLILLESPHRLLATIKDLLDILGDREISVACEMTKMYEDYFRGTLSDAHDYYQQETIRGEYTIVIAGKEESSEPWAEDRLRLALNDALAGEKSIAQIAREYAKLSNWPRRKVYDLLVSLQSDQEAG
jgi:16S rRNA (cytidine1402-2'-O)-methyltransferase